MKNNKKITKFISIGTTCLLLSSSSLAEEKEIKEKLLIPNFQNNAYYLLTNHQKQNKIEEKVEDKTEFEKNLEYFRKKFYPTMIEGIRYGK